MSAGQLLHRISSWDGLTLAVAEWPCRSERLPLLCLPGLVRTWGDFEDLATRFSDRRRIVAVDYLGRGQSSRAPNVSRYTPEACVRDIGDICAALHLHRVIAIGTSFGGLLTMGLAAMRPTLLAGAVLNDVGPEVGSAGAAFIREFVARDPALPDVDACARLLRSVLPPLSLQTDEDWRRMARLTYAPGLDGRWHPSWDTRIVRLLKGPMRDLWPLFGGLAHVPLLLVRGVISDVLLEPTVRRMQTLRPEMAVVEIEGIGHAPTLGEPEALVWMDVFLERVG